MTAPRPSELKGHTGVVRSLAFSPDGAWLGSAGEDGTLWLWSMATGAGQRLSADRLPVNAVGWLPDGALLSLSFTGQLRRWDPKTGKGKLLVDREASSSALAVSPDGSTVATFSDSLTTIDLWPLTGGAPKTLTGLKTRTARSLGWSHDGAWVSMASHHTTVRIWNSKTGRARLLEDHPDTVFYVAFAPDRPELACVTVNHQLRIWDLTTLAFVDLPLGEEVPRALAYAPDGKSLVVGDGAGVLLRWTFASQKRQPLRGHENPIAEVAFLPDGRLLSASDDEPLRLWSARGTKSTATPWGTGEVSSLAVSPDGAWAALGQAPGALLRFRVADLSLASDGPAPAASPRRGAAGR